MEKVKIDYKKRELLEQDSQKDVSFMVEETSLNIQQDVIATKRELKKVQSEIQDLKSSYPLDVPKYLALKAKEEGLTKGLSLIAELQQELGIQVSTQ